MGRVERKLTSGIVKTKQNIKYKSLLVLLAVALLGSNVQAGEPIFYVFKDRNGRTLMQDHIPEELKYRGYRIVNSNGVTLRTIAPYKKNVAKPAKQTQPARIQEADLDLLRRYSSVQDIEVARDNHLYQLGEIISSIEEHTKAFERNLNEMEARKASLVQEGKPVDAKLTSDMEMITARIAENREYLSRKKIEHSRLSDQYTYEIARFKELTAHAIE